MKYLFFIGGDMDLFVVTFLYGIITAIFGIYAMEHWFWWPGIFAVIMIHQYCKSLSDA